MGYGFSLIGVKIGNISMGVRTLVNFVSVVQAVIIWATNQQTITNFLHIQSGLVTALNKFTSNYELVMVQVKAFVLKCMRHKFLSFAKYISTKSDNIADAISSKQ